MLINIRSTFKRFVFYLYKNTKSKPILNIIWLFSEKVGVMSLNLLVSVLLARQLGAEQFGIINYLISFIAIISTFSTLGLNGIIVRELVNKEYSEKMVLGVSLTLRWLGGVGAVLLTTVITFFVYNDTLVVKEWLILSSMGAAFVSFYLFDFYFQSRVESKYVVKVNLSVLCFTSILKLVALYFDSNIEVFLSLVILEPVLKGTLLFIIYKFYSSNDKSFEFDLSYSKKLLGQSKWLILSGFMAIIYLKIDQLMIGDMLGGHELGIYSIAVQLSEVWYFFPAAIVSSFFPKLLNLKNDTENYQTLLQKLCDVLFWLAFCLALIVSICSEYIISLLYGDEYILAGQVLNIHIWASVFIFMRALLSKWLIAENLLKYSLITHGLAAVVNVILNTLWIPEYGILGAAWATFISYTVSSYLALFLNHKTIPMAVVMSKSLILPLRLLK